MESVFESQFSWTNLVFTAVFLAGLYFLLQFLQTVLGTVNLFGRRQPRIKRMIFDLLLIFEPVALLILTGMFILINPRFHGLIALLLVIAGFSQIRNYLNGRIVLYDEAISVGKRIKTNQLQGIISKTGKLGLRLQTGQGLHFINYSQLYALGYMLLSGEEVGGFYQIKMVPKAGNTGQRHDLNILDLLTTAPYLEWGHKTELILSTEDPQKIQSRVLVKEEDHLLELLKMIEERGYHCKVLKN